MITDDRDIAELLSLEKEVEERVRKILNDPALFEKYDRNRDGQISDKEQEILERIILFEVYGEHVRSEEARDSPPAKFEFKDRFEIKSALGSGGQGHTYLALDRETGEEVALKELAIGRLNDWKALELFDREADALQSLSHPAIPTYIDAFHVDDDVGRRFFIVQEYVPGLDLARRLDAGERWEETRVLKLMHDMLAVLTYLHGLTPPIIHRDIKPANIIEQEDGSIRLVDFGSVQNAIPKTVGGSTISGTPGYMPLEQMMGRSVAASDLYALAATVVHLLSRTHPGDLDMHRSRIEFSDRVDCGERLQKILGDMLEPHVEDRPQTASSVKRYLSKLERVASHVDSIIGAPPLRKGGIADKAILEVLASLDMDMAVDMAMREAPVPRAEPSFDDVPSVFHDRVTHPGVFTAGYNSTAMTLGSSGLVVIPNQDHVMVTSDPSRVNGMLEAVAYGASLPVGFAVYTTIGVLPAFLCLVFMLSMLYLVGSSDLRKPEVTITDEVVKVRSGAFNQKTFDRGGRFTHGESTVWYSSQGKAETIYRDLTIWEAKRLADYLNDVLESD